MRVLFKSQETGCQVVVSPITTEGCFCMFDYGGMRMAEGNDEGSHGFCLSCTSAWS